jgi:diguanylate cyclase (GGDEF)-like protein
MRYLKSLTRWWVPPAFDGWQAVTRQAYFVNLVLNGLLLVSVAIFVGNEIGAKTPFAVKAINALAILLLLPCYVLLRQRRIAMVQMWLLSVVFICVTAGIAALGSVRAPITSVYLAGVIICGLLFDRKGVLISTAICSLSVLGLIWAENAGLLATPNTRVGIPQWVTYTVMFGFTGSLIQSINRVSKDALLRAESELVQRKKSEESLHIANRALIQRVREVEQLQQELRELSHRDGLTGLYNRRYLIDAVSRELTLAERNKIPMSLVMLDVDHFKSINDNQGHQSGDAVLVQLAKLLANMARSSDIVCRYGGEEFLLVLTGASLETAMARADGIRVACEAQMINFQGHSLKVTVSAGVAVFPEHGRTLNELLQGADQALYQAKRNGRNCTVAWTGDPSMVSTISP